MNVWIGWGLMFGGRSIDWMVRLTKMALSTSCVLLLRFHLWYPKKMLLSPFTTVHIWNCTQLKPQPKKAYCYQDQKCHRHFSYPKILVNYPWAAKHSYSSANWATWSIRLSYFCSQQYFIVTYSYLTYFLELMTVYRLETRGLVSDSGARRIYYLNHTLIIMLSPLLTNRWITVFWVRCWRPLLESFWTLAIILTWFWKY